jgi:peptidoglycan/LPS O-acetylase OafA/YrhL
MKRHYPALRGVAIFLVVLHHAIVLGTSFPGDWGFKISTGLGADVLLVISMLGWVAVPIFLFISGSFYAYAARGTPPEISLKVVKSNFIGLLWPYTIWSLVYYSVEWLGRGVTYSFTGLIKNLLIGYPFHFVPLIVFFILISPLLIKFGWKIGWFWLLGAIAGYQIFLILALDSFQYGLVLPDWTDNFVIPVLARTMADWGIYFPLGLYFALNTNKITPVLARGKWYFLILGFLLFGLTASHALGYINFPHSRHLYPLMLIFIVPVLQRDWIPSRKFFESVGKHAYGLYLTHLVVIFITLMLLYQIFPSLLAQPYLIHLVLFLISLFLPLQIITWLNHSRFSRFSPFLFG